MKEHELNDPTLKGKTDAEKKKELERRKRLEKLAIEDRISHLERMENEDQKDPLNVLFPAREGFTGPLKDRKRTDKKWTWVILIMVAFFVVHGFTCKTSIKYFLRFQWRGSIQTLQRA